MIFGSPTWALEPDISYRPSAALAIQRPKGYEVGKAQVDLANYVLESDAIELTELHQTVELCSQLDVDVMTFIGVFEHVQDPRAILDAMRKNPECSIFLFLCSDVQRHHFR